MTDNDTKLCIVIDGFFKSLMLDNNKNARYLIVLTKVILYTLSYNRPILCVNAFSSVYLPFYSIDCYTKCMFLIEMHPLEIVNRHYWHKKTFADKYNAIMQNNWMQLSIVCLFVQRDDVFSICWVKYCKSSASFELLRLLFFLLNKKSKRYFFRLYDTIMSVNNMWSNSYSFTQNLR